VKLLSVALVTFFLSACATPDQTFLDSLRNPRAACTEYVNNPNASIAEVSKIVKSELCDGDCESPKVTEISSSSSQAEASSNGWLSCPAAAKLTNGHIINGWFRIFRAPYAGQLTYLWNSRAEDISNERVGLLKAKYGVSAYKAYSLAMNKWTKCHASIVAPSDLYGPRDPQYWDLEMQVDRYDARSKRMACGPKPIPSAFAYQ